MFSAQDFIQDNRQSHVTIASSNNIDVEYGLKTKVKTNQNMMIFWIKKAIPFLAKFQQLDDGALTPRNSKLGGKSSIDPVVEYADTVEINSAPSSVTFKMPSEQALPLDSRKQFVTDFVANEMLYHAEIQDSFVKISSHLDVLNHLGGGEYLKTYDQEIVDGLRKISLFFIQSIRIAPQIEWRPEFEELRLGFEKFASKMENYMISFEKTFPGSSPALERTSFILSGIRNRLEIYQRICRIPSSAAYWDLSLDLRKVIDVFYNQEKDYQTFLASQPAALEQFQILGVLDTETGKAGTIASKLLLKASQELSENMIYNPCTYGLSHRKMELAEAYEAHSKYTTSVLERLYDYRDTTSRAWHNASEELSDTQLESLIAAFKKDLAKPVDRLIHFQHILCLFKSYSSIDQVQVAFAKYVVDALLKQYLISHAAEITPTLKEIKFS